MGQKQTPAHAGASNWAGPCDTGHISKLWKAGESFCMWIINKEATERVLLRLLKKGGDRENPLQTPEERRRQGESSSDSWRKEETGKVLFRLLKREGDRRQTESSLDSWRGEDVGLGTLCESRKSEIHSAWPFAVRCRVCRAVGEETKYLYSTEGGPGEKSSDFTFQKVDRGGVWRAFWLHTWDICGTKSNTHTF